MSWKPGAKDSRDKTIQMELIFHWDLDGERLSALKMGSDLPVSERVLCDEVIKENEGLRIWVYQDEKTLSSSTTTRRVFSVTIFCLETWSAERRWEKSLDLSPGGVNSEGVVVGWKFGEVSFLDINENMMFLQSPNSGLCYSKSMLLCPYHPPALLWHTQRN